MVTNTIDRIKAKLSESRAIVLYFFNDNCSPCLALRPKVIHLVEKEFPLLALEFINASENQEITAEFGVFSAPAILIFFEGKEYIRFGKYVSIEELKEKINRYYKVLFNENLTSQNNSGD